MKLNQKHLWLSVLTGILIFYQLYSIVQLLGMVEVWRSNLNRFPFYFYALFTVFGATGLGLAVGSGYRKTGLLRSFWCIQLFTFALRCYQFYEVMSILKEHPSRIRLSDDYYVGMSITVLSGIAAITGLWMLRNGRAPVPPPDNGSLFIESTKTKRFINWLVDRFVILILVLDVVHIYPVWGDRNLSQQNLFWHFIIVSVIYYTIVEGVFNTSAGKALTGTVVIKAEGGKPGFFRSLGRSLARLIPFNIFSFLGGGTGWHDQVSRTWVVEETDIETAEKMRTENQFDFERPQTESETGFKL
jgi:hypothetical protein